MSNKPVVNCTLHLPADYMVVGGNGFVFPYNHPNHIEGHNISNEECVKTSRIINIDRAKKQFETMNTIYQWE